MSIEILISVIIPVYNVENYLHQCIDSILEQKPDNIEIFLIDDGSIDSSSQICDDYARTDKRVKVIHKKNGGLSEARNVGISNAIGQYIMFIDSDDYLANGCLNDISGIITESNPDVLIGYFDVVKEFEDGINWNDNKLSEECINKKPPNSVVHYLTHNSIMTTAWRFIVKRTLIINNNLFFIPGISHEDLEWVPRLICSATSFWVYSKPFYIYRIRKNSISTSRKIKSLEDVLKIIDITFSYYETISVSEKKHYLSMIIYWQFQHVYRSYSYCNYHEKQLFKKWLKNNSKKAITISKYSRKLYFLTRLFGILSALFIYNNILRKGIKKYAH